MKIAQPLTKSMRDYRSFLAHFFDERPFSCGRKKILMLKEIEEKAILAITLKTTFEIRTIA